MQGADRRKRARSEAPADATAEKAGKADQRPAALRRGQHMPLATCCSHPCGPTTAGEVAAAPPRCATPASPGGHGGKTVEAGAHAPAPPRHPAPLSDTLAAAAPAATLPRARSAGAAQAAAAAASRCGSNASAGAVPAAAQVQRQARPGAASGDVSAPGPASRTSSGTMHAWPRLQMPQQGGLSADNEPAPTNDDDSDPVSGDVVEDLRREDLQYQGAYYHRRRKRRPRPRKSYPGCRGPDPSSI